ncbi:F-box family protein [Dorcoceras hygrometricum]|uniref:F-box family protein n=1 Tax=Dorcoceras hygrometricum TaxID=472368 RepID=A0A2Z7B1Y9_9LAMI|nr:F-box family protein [Dorcoceras hygrometricum]
MAYTKSRVQWRSIDVVVDNDDLLSTILLFVPVKPLFCMKTVCKRWRALISAEWFRHMYGLRGRGCDPPSFIICASLRCFFYFSLARYTFRPYQFCFPFTRILQSCHGLLLVEARKSPYGEKLCYVYNPTTGESKNLLIDRRFYNGRVISGLCLAFDPKRSPIYKVIAIRHDLRVSNLYWIDIYDSQTCVWICLEQPFTATNDANFFNGIFWNNGIYWIRRTAATSYYLDLETWIVGRPQRLMTHKRPHTGRLKNYVMESNGHLHYVSFYSRNNKLVLKVSELLHDSVWCEKYKVNLNPISCKFEGMSGPQAAVLCIYRGDKEEDSAAFFLVRGKIIFYRFCDGYFLDLFHCPIMESHKGDGLHYQRNHAFEIIESLAPV